MPNEPRIQRPRLVHVAGPFNDRPAVGEDGKLVSFDHELEQEAVVADFALRFQVAGQLLEVEFAGATMRHLDGITATQARRLRAVFAFEPLKTAALATGVIDL